LTNTKTAEQPILQANLASQVLGLQTTSGTIKTGLVVPHTEELTIKIKILLQTNCHDNPGRDIQIKILGTTQLHGKIRNCSAKFVANLDTLLFSGETRSRATFMQDCQKPKFNIEVKNNAAQSN